MVRKNPPLEIAAVRALGRRPRPPRGDHRAANRVVDREHSSRIAGAAVGSPVP